MKSLTIVNRTAPYGQSNGIEALDLCLAAASFGQEVCLVFLEDGVFQLLKDQTPESIEHKNYSKTFAALAFYDVEDIFVCQHSLDSRQLTPEDLCVDVTLLSHQDVVSKLKTHPVVTF